MDVDIGKAVLPAGWTVDQPRADEFVLGVYAAGWVTVNVGLREFAFGYGAHVRIPTVEKRARYTGRGWRTLLFNDAIVALQDVLRGLR